MKLTGTLVKLSIFSVVLVIFTVMIIVVFGHFLFDRTNKYSAESPTSAAARGPVRPRLGR